MNVDEIDGDAENKTGCNFSSLNLFLQVISKTRYLLKVSNATLEQCSLPCSADNLVPMFFDTRIRRYLRFWTG